jgi:hypothetical protein
VAYAAKRGTAAEDGSGANSPFAEATLASLEELGLEINFLFRRVRDQVLARTNRRQEPFLYGSLPSEPPFFKAVMPHYWHRGLPDPVDSCCWHSEKVLERCTNMPANSRHSARASAGREHAVLEPALVSPFNLSACGDCHD